MEEKVNVVLEGLNEEQKNAVSCTRGPVLIVAGAGSGKTRVLTSRIALLLAEETDPTRILALTFTKKAAGEMKERIAAMVGDRSARRLVMGTFHAVFVRFLREYAASLGYPERFVIYDTSDSQSAMKTCIKELGLDDKVYKPREVLSRISMAKNNLITVNGYRNSRELQTADYHARRPRLCDLYELYQKKLKESGVMDFDDILLNMNYLLRDNPEALRAISERFLYIMVDEYQDTNYSPVPDTQEAGLRSPQHLRGRRRQPVDLRLPRRQDREHTELPQGLSRLPHIPAGEELPLHLDHSRRSQHAHRPQRRPHPEGMLRGGGRKARRSGC